MGHHIVGKRRIPGQHPIDALLVQGKELDVERRFAARDIALGRPSIDGRAK